MTNYYKLTTHPLSSKLRSLNESERAANKAAIDLAQELGAKGTNGRVFFFEGDKPGKPWVKSKTQKWDAGVAFVPSQKSLEGQELQCRIDDLPDSYGWGTGAMIHLFGDHEKLNYVNHNENGEWTGSGCNIFDELRNHGIFGYKIREDAVYYEGDPFWIFLDGEEGAEEINNIQYREA